MIIYTPVPPEVLWSKIEKEEAQIIEGKVQGIPVELKIWPGNNVAVVERILSTDPAHFLNSSCQPGSKIIR
ncbi:MAG TPA: ribonuclease [Clostridia bacterium]|jgi:hypothetical protein|nr:YlzJ-like family protein [Clostridia bacterium]HHY05395.1 ribonuclease [Clostridia bacterium]